MRASFEEQGIAPRGVSALARAGAVAPVIAVLALLVLSSLRIADDLGRSGAIAAALLGAIAGLAAADLLGGVVHWLCDNFGSERTPWVGPLVIAPFREHHVDPQILARKDFFDASSSNAWAALGVLVPWLLVVPAPDDALGCAREGFAFSLSAFAFLTNAFHQWAHQLDPPRLARWLWRLRLAISPEHHARHHQRGDTAYCVTTGWCNAALERWRVLERLERALRRLR